MKLHKVVLSAVAAFALAATATSASAGGRSLKDEPAYKSWSGFYIGAQAGWGWADVNSEFVTAGGAPLGANDSVNIDSGILGVQVGYQHQFGKLVLGVEANAIALLDPDGVELHHEHTRLLPVGGDGPRQDLDL